jgi:outer membrane protein assembly factor BamB
MKNELLKWLPTLAALVALAALIVWLLVPGRLNLFSRVPGTDRPPGDSGGEAAGNPALRGTTIIGPGTPAQFSGAWPRFRGGDLSNILPESPGSVPLAQQWPADGPRELWTIDVGEGYAGPAILDGKVFLMDYDRAKKQDALRCLSLSDGQEIWRFSYPVNVKRNHGMSRTVPSVTPECIVALGPKCHVVCVETATGKLRWTLDLVNEFGATVPQWYAGQCPLIDGDRVILAPGGSNAMLISVELKSGQVVWRSPNPREWKMSHSSVVPVEFAGRRLLIYCAAGGVVAVDAADGQLVWDTDTWKISIATVPCPVDLGDGRLFLTGGYNAGSMLIKLRAETGSIRPEVVYRLKPDIFGATQHAPVFWRGHLFGTRADGRFVCLDPADGRVVWSSDAESNFGLGGFMLASGLIFAMNDSGKLHLIEAIPTAYKLLGQAQVLKGPESWGPLALANGRLLARDFNKLVCLEVSAR